MTEYSDEQYERDMARIRADLAAEKIMTDAEMIAYLGGSQSECYQASRNEPGGPGVNRTFVYVTNNVYVYDHERGVWLGYGI